MSMPTPPAPPSPTTPPPLPRDAKLGPATDAQPAPVDYYQPQQTSFWRQQWVQDVLPLATSLALHVALIIIGCATYKTVQKVVQVVKEQIIIPESTMADSGPPGGIQHPGVGSDPTRDAAQDLIKDTPQDAGWATKASDQLNQAVL